MSVSSIAFMSLWPIASILGAFLVKNDDEVTCSVSFGLILACLFCSVAFGLINALSLRLMEDHDCDSNCLFFSAVITCVCTVIGTVFIFVCYFGVQIWGFLMPIQMVLSSSFTIWLLFALRHQFHCDYNFEDTNLCCFCSKDRPSRNNISQQVPYRPSIPPNYPLPVITQETVSPGVPYKAPVHKKKAIMSRYLDDSVENLGPSQRTESIDGSIASTNCHPSAPPPSFIGSIASTNCHPSAPPPSFIGSIASTDLHPSAPPQSVAGSMASTNLHPSAPPMSIIGTPYTAHGRNFAQSRPAAR